MEPGSISKCRRPQLRSHRPSERKIGMKQLRCWNFGNQIFYSNFKLAKCWLEESPHDPTTWTAERSEAMISALNFVRQPGSLVPRPTFSELRLKLQNFSAGFKITVQKVSSRLYSTIMMSTIRRWHFILETAKRYASQVRGTLCNRIGFLCSQKIHWKSTCTKKHPWCFSTFPMCFWVLISFHITSTEKKSEASNLPAFMFRNEDSSATRWNEKVMTKCHWTIV